MKNPCKYQVNLQHLVDYLEQTIHSLENAADLEQSMNDRGAACEQFLVAIAALKTKLAQEQTILNQHKNNSIGE